MTLDPHAERFLRALLEIATRGEDDGSYNGTQYLRDCAAIATRLRRVLGEDPPETGEVVAAHEFWLYSRDGLHDEELDQAERVLDAAVAPLGLAVRLTGGYEEPDAARAPERVRP